MGADKHGEELTGGRRERERRKILVGGLNRHCEIDEKV